VSAPIQLQDLIADVAHVYPSAQFEFDPLPSGVCFLWVTLNHRNFVIEYDPKQGVGVSENLPDTPPFVGHDEAYDTLEEGIARFKALLGDAARAAPSAAPALALHDKPISK
jgi:hypothetical protein